MDYLRVEKDHEEIVTVHLSSTNDKVNKLSAAMLRELGGILQGVEHDPGVAGLIFISDKEDNFVVGADLKELESITQPGTAEGMIRSVHEIFNRIENLPFPVIAAIHGHCLGGGLELALACHFRIATDYRKTIIGLPEVKLGLIPAGGGTQRMTRLLGVRKSLPIMMEGRTFNASNAKALGIVDLVVFPFGLLDTAKKCVPFFRRRQSNKRSYPRPVSLDWVLRNIAPARRLFFDFARKQTEKKTARNYPAPIRILECVEQGLAEGFSAGLTAEAVAFDELVLSPESKSLRQLFFATTALKKNPLGNKAVPVKSVGVVGGGFMGSGIAAVTVQAGTPVVLRDISWTSLTLGMKNIWNFLDRQVKKERRNPVERDNLYSQVTPVTEYEHFSTLDVVIEAVFEDLTLKQTVLREVEAATKQKCIFASNTSALPISSIASVSLHPETIVGMHYFSPVSRMPLLEVVVTAQTADWVTATAVALGHQQGKTVITVKDGPGFYTSRILSPFLSEAMALLHEGADIEQVDRAVRNFGFPVGPFKLLDEVGIDVAAHVSGELRGFFGTRGISRQDDFNRLLRADFRGRKNGNGFYRYSKRWWEGKIPPAGFGDSKPVNENVYNYFGSKKRKTIDSAEICQRLVLSMVNEAVLCLQEGIIESPRDGDVGAVLGLGFPPFLGGPFRYLDKVGIATAVLQIEKLADRFGSRFAPAPLLSEMAAKGELFYEEE